MAGEKSGEHGKLLSETKKASKRGRDFLDALDKITAKGQKLSRAQEAQLVSTKKWLERLYRDEDKLHELWLDDMKEEIRASKRTAKPRKK